MEEILIEEKKYISTKRAAKITGYAKDYVGQLCREGRVPARLVGRSWYVLESAIKDHRFGNEDSEDEKKAATLETIPSKEEEPERTFPRYESAPVEVLPSLNILKREHLDLRNDSVQVAEPKEPERLDNTKPYQPAKSLHDSWSSWFDDVDSDELELPVGEAVVETQVLPSVGLAAEDQFEKAAETDAAVMVPLHSMEKESMAHRELMPQKQPSNNPMSAPLSIVDASVGKSMRTRHSRRNTSGSNSLIKAIVLLLGLASVLIAVVNLGYVDGYSNSLSRAGFISGISVYNK